MSKHKPVIGIPADRRMIEPHWFHGVGEKYIQAVVEAADCVPVLVPALGEQHLADWLVSFDGILFTGSPSNVEPHHYQGPPAAEGTWHDPARDATTLPMITRAIGAGLPVFGVCRGFQEMNVALGGSLCPRLHEQPGFLDHREDKDAPLAGQYAPAHPVTLAEDGMLRGLAGQARVEVNSLHSQGIDRLAPGLAVEATADDGVIEAFRVESAPAFALAVQWHPEWQVMQNPFSRALFAAFGEAARQRSTRQ